MSIRRWVRWSAPAAALALTVTLGCIVTVEPIDGGDGGDGGGGPTTITVRLFNATNIGLDPQIFISADALSAEALFASATNKFTSFGDFGLGLLGAGDVAGFDLDCAAVRVLGTPGGSFGNDLQSPEGSGIQRVLSQDAQFNCGDTITFTYSRSGSGFATSFGIN